MTIKRIHGFRFFGDNKFQFHMINAIFIRLIMCLCFFLELFTVFNLFDNWNPYSIKQTEVSAILNSDGSADLTEVSDMPITLVMGRIGQNYDKEKSKSEIKSIK